MTWMIWGSQNCRTPPNVSFMRILKLHGIFGGVVNSWKSLALVVLSHPEGTRSPKVQPRWQLWVFQWQKDLVPESQVPCARGTSPQSHWAFCHVLFASSWTSTCYNDLQCLQHARLRGSMKPCEHWISYGTMQRMQRVLWPPKPCQWTLMWCRVMACRLAICNGSWEQQVIFWQGEKQWWEEMGLQSRLVLAS